MEYGASFIEWSANQCLRNCGKIFESPEQTKRMFYVKQPVGVVQLLPLEFSSCNGYKKSRCSISCRLLCYFKTIRINSNNCFSFRELSIEAKFPNGIFNIINGKPDIIGDILSKNSTVKKITFTGSTKVGSLLMKNSSKTIKNISLELGGNAPFIVFSDADIDLAVEGLINAKFRNAGQTCISANRIFLNKEIYEIFLIKLKDRLKKMKIGSGLKDCDIGPLISKQALQKVENHIQDAIDKGAKLEFGGKLHKPNSLLFEPTFSLISNKIC